MRRAEEVLGEDWEADRLATGGAGLRPFTPRAVTNAGLPPVLPRPGVRSTRPTSPYTLTAAAPHPEGRYPTTPARGRSSGGRQASTVTCTCALVACTTSAVPARTCGLLWRRAPSVLRRRLVVREPLGERMTRTTENDDGPCGTRPPEEAPPTVMDQPGPPLRRRPFGLSVRLDHPRSEGRIRTQKGDEVGAVPERQRSSEGGVCR